MPLEVLIADLTQSNPPLARRHAEEHGFRPISWRMGVTPVVFRFTWLDSSDTDGLRCAYCMNDRERTLCETWFPRWRGFLNHFDNPAVEIAPDEQYTPDMEDPEWKSRFYSDQPGYTDTSDDTRVMPSPSDATGDAFSAIVAGLQTEEIPAQRRTEKVSLHLDPAELLRLETARMSLLDRGLPITRARLIRECVLEMLDEYAMLGEHSDLLARITEGPLDSTASTVRGIL